MKTGIENAKTTLEIYKKLENGEMISIEEVETCWGFIADVYSGMEKRVENVLSFFKPCDKNLFKKILWIKVGKNTDAVYVGYETKEGNESEVSFKRKFLSMSDKELKEWHRKSKQKSLISCLVNIERAKIEIAAYKRKIDKGDKEIEELRNKLKEMKKK